MNILKYLLVIVVGYLLGSLSISVILSRNVMGSDVRSHGSGNAGATNMARVFGMKAGVMTLAGDMLKALIAMWLGKLLLGDIGLAVSGIACIVGHCFPVFHDFKGGKGISVGAAIGIVAHALTNLLDRQRSLTLGNLCAAAVSAGSIVLALLL